MISIAAGPPGARAPIGAGGDANAPAPGPRRDAGACVVVGGRTAVWAPVPDLAAVVVLDEGDEALQEERVPDVARS